MPRAKPALPTPITSPVARPIKPKKTVEEVMIIETAGVAVAVVGPASPGSDITLGGDEGVKKVKSGVKVEVKGKKVEVC